MRLFRKADDRSTAQPESAIAVDDVTSRAEEASAIDAVSRGVDPDVDLTAVADSGPDTEVELALEEGPTPPEATNGPAVIDEDLPPPPPPKSADEPAPVVEEPPQAEVPGGEGPDAAASQDPPPIPEMPKELGQDPEPMVLPRIIAVANQKGGVGKTTTAVNLGAGLAELGFRVLVVDLDPQGNASTGLGINHRSVQGSVYDVLMNEAAVEDCVEPTSVRNLFVVPATIDLAGAEIELVPAMSREFKLRRALEQVRDDYDFTLIDCPPSLGLLTVNGLAAATDVIVPIQCEYYALEGLGQLLRNVSLVRQNLNPALDIRGIVLTMYDARTKLAEQVEHEVREHFGPKVYRTVVPRTVRISEAPSFGQPITVFDASSRGAIAYRELAKEVSRGATRRAG